jgi:hypothetical protein
MTTDPLLPADTDTDPPDTPAVPSAELVVRPPEPPAPSQLQRRTLADWRSRLPALAQHPTVRTAATLAAGIGLGLVADVVRRSVLGGGDQSSVEGPASTSIRYVVEPAVVIHHVVHHHVLQYVLPPITLGREMPMRLPGG